MSKSKKVGKPKPNKGNQVKRQALLKHNEEVLAKFK
jgi:uncharacterized protein (DUF4415 family)